MDTNQMIRREKTGKRTLLFQIGVTLVPLVLFMLLLVSRTVYKSAIDGYLMSQNDLMAERLDIIYDTMYNSRDTIYPLKAVLLDYLEENAEICAEPVTQQEQDANEAHTIDDDWWTVEWFERMPEEVKRYHAKAEVEILNSVMYYAREYVNLSDLLIIDVNEPYQGFVFSACGHCKDFLSFGDIIEFDLDDHPSLKSLLTDPSYRTEYEKTNNFPMKGSYYVAYRPIFYDGKIRAVMMLPYSWGGLRDAMSDILFKAFMAGIGGLIISLMIILVLLYRKAIAPVKKIQEGIQDYINTKDSAAVCEKLGCISETNEVGKLSKDLSAMVQAIDHYTAENVRLAEDRERVRTELSLASRIQESMLSQDWPQSELFALAASMTPALDVGGDFYDFFYIDNDHLALVIADVSGKGIPAALFMMMCKNIIKNYAREGLSPSEVIARTNRCILEYKRNTMFVTVWLGIYETTTGHVTAVNAGHEYPMIKTADGGFELYKDVHSIFVGGIDEVCFRQYEFDLEEGGTLFLYTDGTAEATNSSDELFGTSRMIEALNRNCDSSPEELISTMKSAINDFVGDAPQFDDLTMLVIKRI